MTKAIYPGTFDPFTEGHFSLVKQASELFDEVVVLVATNANKTDCLFDPERRAVSISEDLKECQNVTVQVLDSKELLTDFAEQRGITNIIRGIRSGAEFDTELAYMDSLQDLCNSDEAVLTPVFLTAYLQLRNFSSTLVRSLLKCNGWVNKLSYFVPVNTALAIIDAKQHEFLEDCWDSACKGLSEECNCCYMNYRVLEAYSDRAYHNKDHLVFCLKELYKMMVDAYRVKLNPVDVMAIFWHDYVYVPGAKDNEVRSAQACEEFLTSIGVPTRDIEYVRSEILITDGRETVFGSHVRDADLAILGQDSTIYAKYVAKVRVEFNCSDEDFNNGRIKWIDGMLKKSSIFSTPYFRDKYEIAAELNLKRELYERTIGK
jgi:pantetheine-phosphate adenylyltransferase